jgi:hypothetical protein
MPAMMNHAHFSLTCLVTSVVTALVLATGCADEMETDSTSASSSSPGATASVPDDELAARIIELYAIEDRLKRTDMLVSILSDLKPGQGPSLAATLDALERVDTTNREFEAVLIVAGWSNIDPVAASHWVIGNAREKVVRSEMLNESIYRWALQDPEGLLRDSYILPYHQGGWDASSLRALVRGWYESGKPGLDDFVYGLPAQSTDRQRAVSQLIATKLEHEGIEPVIEWATNEVRGEIAFKQYIYSRLAGDIAKTDPERAVAWCDEVCDTELGKEIPLWLATSWVMNEGGKAMEWIVVRDAEVVSNRVGARAAYRRFLLTDKDAAIAWMEGTSEEMRTGYEGMQGPLYIYVNEKSGLGFDEEALEWTKYITGKPQREELLVKIARRWLRRDPDAAERWLADAPLSQEQKDEAHTNPKTPGLSGGGPKFGPRDRILR